MSLAYREKLRNVGFDQIVDLCYQHIPPYGKSDIKIFHISLQYEKDLETVYFAILDVFQGHSNTFCVS